VNRFHELQTFYLDMEDDSKMKHWTTWLVTSYKASDLLIKGCPARLIPFPRDTRLMHLLTVSLST